MTTSPRQIVKDALAVTGYPVLGRIPDNIGKVTLVLGLGSVTPGPPQGQLTWTLRLAVLSPLRDETAEDDLEAAVLVVVDALAAADPLALTGGTRGVIADDAYHGFTLELEVYTPVTTTP